MRTDRKTEDRVASSLTEPSGKQRWRGWHRDSRSHQYDGTIRTGSLCRVDHRHLEAAFDTKHLLQTAVAKSRVKPSYPVSALTV